MGQAKRRGTFEQRQETAQPRPAAAPPTKIWVIILYDRSERGKNHLLAELKNAQKPLVDELSRSMDAFTEDKGTFMVYARSNHGHLGHLMYAQVVGEISQTIFPRIATELMEEGDQGNFILALSPENEALVKLALTPVPPPATR